MFIRKREDFENDDENWDEDPNSISYKKKCLLLRITSKNTLLGDKIKWKKLEELEDPTEEEILNILNTSYFDDDDVDLVD